jgi:hypothetical protein
MIYPKQSSNVSNGPFHEKGEIRLDREREREREREMYNSILERGKREGRKINSLTVAFTLGYMAALGRDTNAETLPKPKACVTGVRFFRERSLSVIFQTQITNMYIIG